jgi:S1-C subfamily serine protease
VRVPSAAFQALVEHHAQVSDMLGARLGVTGPLHPWFDTEYPSGVVVLDPGTGAYAAAGITAGAVVIAGHDRKPVPDPPTLIAQCEAAHPQSFITVAVRRDPAQAPVTFDVRLDGGGAPVAAVTETETETETTE